MKKKNPKILLVNRCFILNNENKILIIKRHPEDRKDANKWEVPGGKLDEGENLIVSKNREVVEETGLVLEQINPLVFADSYVIEDGKYKDFSYIMLYSINKIKKGKVKLSEEHTEYAWVNYKEMLKKDLTSEARKAAMVLRSYLVKR